jgi:hypothetical protein
VNPKLTVFTGSDHNSWARTYNDVNTWTWLLAQKKPDVAITSPASGTVVVPGGPLSLAASAQDKDGVALTGANVQWSSNLDGLLGVGANLTVSNLSIGSHVITCQAVDNKYRGRRTQITVTVPYAGAFTTRFDFGSPAAGFLTTDPGWNNITSPLVGNAGSIVNNAVDINGNPIGLRAEITQRFDNFNTNGATTSVLYPVTAQNDTMYVSATYPVGQVLLSGLNPAQTYNFTFYASRTSSGNRTSVYAINGVSTSLNASDNTTQTASLLNLVPNSAGQLTLTLSIGSGATFGYLGVMTITTTGPSQTPLQAWRALHGLAANGSQDLSTPAGDGVSNLLKFAFNLAPSAGDLPLPQNRVMTATGTSGLPLVQTDGSNHLTATFLRRKAATNSGTTYIPEFTEDLAGPWTTLATTPTITSVDSTWERVTYTNSAVISAATKRFLRVRVTAP